jgi:hypothetical protein
MRAIADYVGHLSHVTGRPLGLSDVRSALAKGFGGGALGISEIAAALSYAEDHWQEWALPAGQDAGPAVKDPAP